MGVFAIRNSADADGAVIECAGEELGEIAPLLECFSEMRAGSATIITQ